MPDLRLLSLFCHIFPLSEKLGAAKAESRGSSGSDSDSSSLPSLEEEDDGHGSKAKPQQVKSRKKSEEGRGTSKGKGVIGPIYAFLRLCAWNSCAHGLPVKTRMKRTQR